MVYLTVWFVLFFFSNCLLGLVFYFTLNFTFYIQVSLLYIHSDVHLFITSASFGNTNAVMISSPTICNVTWWLRGHWFCLCLKGARWIKAYPIMISVICQFSFTNRRSQVNFALYYYHLSLHVVYFATVCKGLGFLCLFIYTSASWK